MTEYRKFAASSDLHPSFPRPFAEVDPAEIAVENPAKPVVDLPLWDAPVDICEDSLEYLVLVGLPGVPISEVVVRVVRGVLEIRAIKLQRAAEEGRRYYRIEREFGICRRLFELPANADRDQLRYDLLDGVLRIRLPKNPPDPVAAALPKITPEIETKTLPKPPPAITDAASSAHVQPDTQAV